VEARQSGLARYHEFHDKMSQNQCPGGKNLLAFSSVSPAGFSLLEKPALMKMIYASL
jgi:hypothetical protein